MPTYTAYFRTAAEWAEETIKARTPMQALAKARAFHDAHTEELSFQQYDGISPVNEIEIEGPTGEVALWRDDDLRLRLAASDLLEALEQALVALNIAPRFSVPILGVADSYAVAAICEAAIAKAKGGAP